MKPYHQANDGQLKQVTRKVHPRTAWAANLPGAIASTVKKRKAPKKATVPEARIQDLVEQYLDALGIPYIHIPALLYTGAFANRSANGGLIGAMRHASQYVTGFPDIVAFHKEKKIFLPIELKTEIGKLSANQIKWKHAIDTQVCRSFEEAKKLIDNWRTESC
jgi:hypothetical protein